MSDAALKLQWKTFQTGDIVANLLGASLFLYLAVLLNRRIRRRQEIALLYQPLGADSSDAHAHAQSRGGAAGAWSYGDYEYDAGADETTDGRYRRGESVWDVEDDEDEHAADSRGATGPAAGQRKSAEQGRGNELFAIGDEDDGQAQASRS